MDSTKRGLPPVLAKPIGPFASALAAAEEAAAASGERGFASAEPPARKRARENETEEKPMVIPIQAPFHDAIERRAREELSGQKPSSNSTLSILHQSTGLAAAAEEGDVPLLIANMLPGLKETKSDKERFELNMAARPPELEPTDEAFEKVPIEEFGMAMLRGMGYKEEVGVGLGDNARKVEPYLLEGRPALLGLGARPKQALGGGGELANPRHRGRVFITIGSLVRLVNGTYAVVVQTDGVPGLDAVRVCINHLEPSGRLKEMILGKKTLVLEDATKLPVDHPGRLMVLAYERQIKKATAAAEAKGVAVDASLWLREGILVKIVDEAHAHFKEKCVVQHVTDAQRRLCMLQTGEGKTVADVPQSSLQTVVPKPGGPVVVVLATSDVRQGETGAVVELDKKAQRALVRFDHALKTSWLSYDSICQLAVHDDI